MRMPLRLAAAGLTLLTVLTASACGSDAPAAASGTTPDPALAALPQIPFPAALNPVDPYTKLPTVAAASGGGTTLALQVADGTCNVVIGSTAGGQTQIGAHAPGKGQPAPAGKADLPQGAAQALGPANSATVTTADGTVSVVCGDRGAAVTVPAKDVEGTVVGTARSKGIDGGRVLIVSGSADTMAAALA
ncbi:hypothetical protein [Kitasatospora sp. LaBMicrA B282]|uniref:hypothetical protein n=1 Tax=Kitasatospora sp. LaBMicrA B282 TaxID=3420949 RepID=UPI003D12DB19